MISRSTSIATILDCTQNHRIKDVSIIPISAIIKIMDLYLFNSSDVVSYLFGLTSNLSPDF
jgi:hypothetical protein